MPDNSRAYIGLTGLKEIPNGRQGSCATHQPLTELLKGFVKSNEEKSCKADYVPARTHANHPSFGSHCRSQPASTTEILVFFLIVIVTVFLNKCRRVAKATGASIVLSLADAEASETFEASSLGTADEVRKCSASYIPFPSCLPLQFLENKAYGCEGRLYQCVSICFPLTQSPSQSVADFTWDSSYTGTQKVPQLWQALLEHLTYHSSYHPGRICPIRPVRTSCILCADAEKCGHIYLAVA